MTVKDLKLYLEKYFNITDSKLLKFKFSEETLLKDCKLKKKNRIKLVGTERPLTALGKKAQKRHEVLSQFFGTNKSNNVVFFFNLFV